MVHKSIFSVLFLCITVISSFTSCCRSREQMWDDTQTAGRHMSRGICSLGGKQGDSRQVCSRDEFYATNSPQMHYQNEYIPLVDLDCSDEIAMADFVARHAKESPGDPGSSIPGIDAFRDPSTMPQVSDVFATVHFPYDSSLIKGDANLKPLKGIADYMKTHPNVYIFIEGHCDERGPEAYNLALGARRSNSVRNFLVKEGVSPDNLFTISYGKERPAILGHNEDAWAQNRRAEFKLYSR